MMGMRGLRGGLAIMLIVLLHERANGDKQCENGKCGALQGKYMCVGWHQTGGCRSDGKREKNGDKACSELVAADASGYCQCGDDDIINWVKVREVGCGHATFRCSEECALQDRYKCVGWRQTGDCSSEGPREDENDKGCSEEIESRSSGYCECGGDRRIRRAGCDAAQDQDNFTCEEECASEVDYYEILGLETHANMQAVKKAFRRMSIKYHPDKVGKDDATAKARFEELRTVYDVLSDPNKKTMYDMGGIIPENGKQLEKAQGMRGKMEVPLEHFYNGATFTSYIQRRVICRGCAHKNNGRCNKCNQQCPNEIKTVQVQFGPMVINQKQEVRSEEKCKDQQTPLEVVIEKGMRSGSTIDFPLMGEQRPGMVPGDLQMELPVAAHNVFKWKGNDLHMTIQITLKQALLGFKKEVKHLDGRSVYIESGDIVKPGQILKLSEEGMPKHNFPSERGNLYAEVQIQMPSKLEESHKSWLQSNLPE